jgi:FkbM family methyltransferase
MFVTNILKGIRKKLSQAKSKPRYQSFSWIQKRILKHLDDHSIKLFTFRDFKVFYKRPYELIKTYEELFLDEIYRFQTISEQPIIIDCGANIGLSSLYFKSIYPNAILHAFEPDAALFQLLEKNAQVNGFTNTHLHQAAVWIEDTNLSFSSKGSEASHIDLSNQSEHQVKAIRLSSFLTQFERIDFLKMDIEGAEFQVVADCLEGLKKVDHFFLEYHGKVDQTKQLYTLLHQVESIGFNVYIKMAADQLKSPFYEKQTGTPYDVQLNIFCYKQIH